MKKNKTLVLLALLLITIILVVLGIWPSIKSLSENKKEIVRQKQALEELLARGQNIVKNQNNLALVEANIGILDGAYLQTGQELNFITDLEQAATMNGVEQTIDFNNTAGSEAAGVKAIPIVLGLNGSMKEIMNYLNTLERLPYYIDIGKVTISAANGDYEGRRAGQQVYEGEAKEAPTPETMVSVNLTGTTYWK